ncbi:hypothetical protein LTS15_007366 [Exophiala xenobiotica]|nr:hypothetical protein LTS15_007366 [Exophiala xenobiotica]
MQYLKYNAFSGLGTGLIVLVIQLRSNYYTNTLIQEVQNDTKALGARQTKLEQTLENWQKETTRCTASYEETARELQALGW